MGQTRQHARLLFLLGVDQLIVGINKMDSCGWDEGRFTEIKEEFQKMLQMIGFKVKKIPFIPYSGFNGDNLVDKTDKAPWYKGWSANINPQKKKLSKKEEKTLVKRIKAKLKNGEELDSDEEEFAIEKDLI